ncbi:MAG: large subunit ribosomal protein L25 [Planctomycetota bacterium]|jgi:large subunit ribosomal protein L25
MSAELTAKVRTKLGSRSARYLRLDGQIPCSIQGEDHDNVVFSINEREFLAARRKHEHLFDFKMEGGEDETGIVRELQWGPFSTDIIHVEFRRVIRGKETEAEVEIEFRGNPASGVLNHIHSHVTIRAIPSLFPDSLILKVDGIEEGVTLHASDLELPEGLSLAGDPKQVIATCSAAAGVAREDDEVDEVEETPTEA